MNRVLGAARMHLAHPLVILGVPWLVVGISFAVNLAIWGLAGIDAMDGDATTGGLVSLYITVMVVFVQAVTQMFPFALGLSLSRRAFYLGTALVAGLQALGYGVALTALTAVENATGGWGVGLDFWAPGAVDVGNPALQLVVFAVPMLAFSFLGIGVGVVYKRWGATGVWTLSVGSFAAAGLLAVLITWQQAWGDVGGWLMDRSVSTLTIGLPAAIAALLAAASYAGLRRSVP
jgi:hypothetical protein